MEQNIALYENLALIFGVAAGVFLIASIVLCIAFDVKNVISKQLGLTEKQALKRMQKDAEAAEKTTKKQASRVRQLVSGAVPTGSTKDKTHDDADSETMQLDADSETTQLDADAETTALHASEDMGWGESGDTVVLHEEAETGVLSANIDAYTYKQFMLVKHIMLIHTDEIIG